MITFESQESYEAKHYDVNIIMDSAPVEQQPVKKRKKPKVAKKQKKQVIDDLDDPPMFYDQGTKGGTWVDRILLSRSLRFFVMFLIFAVIIPTVVYITVFSVEKDGDSYNIPGTCILLPDFRVPCLPGRSPTWQQCGKVGCCWNGGECFHSAPSSYQYQQSSHIDDDINSRPNIDLTLKPRLTKTAFGSPAIQSVKATVQAITSDRLQVLIQNAQGFDNVEPTGNLQESQFNVTVYQPAFFLDVSRRDDLNGSSLLMSTSFGPIIASDNYWEVTLQLPRDSQVFGLGHLRLTTVEYSPQALYNHPRNTASHPVVMCIDSQGRVHGVYLANTGPLEIAFNDRSNLLIVRSIATEGFNIHVFAGPTPREVMRQLTDVIGRPVLPPYWSLGLHVCRGQADPSNDDVNMTAILQEWNGFRTAAAAMDLPYDSHCLHERLLGDLTLSLTEDDATAVQGALKTLFEDRRRFVLSLPPAVIVDSPAHTAAVSQEVLVVVSSTNSTPYEGMLWNRAVCYPDWSHPDAQGWLATQLQQLEKDLDVEGTGVFAGVVLQENWPGDQTNHSRESLPYIPEAMNGSLSDGTIWWEAANSNGSRHHLWHNTYGLQQTVATRASFSTGDGLMLLSAATTPGSGAVAGTHNQMSAQVSAMWTSLKETLTSALGLGLVGIPLASGGPVCGNTDDFDPKEHEALCLKWYLLSSVLPLMRVSSVYPYRDPPSLFSGYSRQAALRAIQLRYTLLPYYYTLFQEANKTGSPVARPLFFDFYQDNRTWSIEEQFLLGSALMVAPVLVPDAINVQVYLPNENITWYEFQGGKSVNNGTGGKIIMVPNWETEILILLRGGYIVPTQDAGLSTQSSRLNNHTMVVGLDCVDNNECTATGQVYLDSADGKNEILNLFADQTEFTISNLEKAQFLCPVQRDIQTISSILKEIRVFGFNSTNTPNAVTVNGNPIPDAKIEHKPVDNTLILSNLDTDWCDSAEGLDKLTVSWT